MCAYNEERNIGGLIENLLNQPLTSCRLIEIIVVASGCTDRTVPIVQQWSLRDSRVKLIVQHTREGKATALNELLREYRGDILVHVDADHVPCEGALNFLLERFQDPHVGAVSGLQVPIGTEGFMGKVNTVVWALHNETQKYLNHTGKAQHLGGVLFAIRRGLCRQVPEDIVNDDAFMGVQCWLKKRRICLETRALAFFNGAKNLSDFVAQRRRVVYGHLQVKKLTGVRPMVFEMCPPSDKLRIFRNWVSANRRLLAYFLSVSLIELWVNLLARLDQVRGDGRHKIWKIAASTKAKLNSRILNR